MRSTILLFGLLTACGGNTQGPGDDAKAGRDGDGDGDGSVDTGSNIDTFEPALAEAPGLDRVGSYAHTLPENPRTVIFLGDSITAGSGAGSPDESYTNLLVHNTNTWPDWDGLDLATRYPGIAVVDVSGSGAWTGTVLERQIGRFEALYPLPFAGEVLVVITVGGNDLQSVLLDPGGVEDRVEKTVENWRLIADYFLDEQNFPDGATVLMANVYEPTDAAGQAGSCFYGLDISSLLPSLHDANTQLRSLAEDGGFSALDMRGTFLGHGFNYSDPSNPHYDDADPSLWMRNDCIHPNPRGHHEIRAMFWRGVVGG